MVHVSNHFLNPTEDIPSHRLAFSFSGLGQVLEFMYTAKLSLSPQNVEDVFAVASFLQMQEIVNACSAYQSVASSTSATPLDCTARKYTDIPD